MTAAILSGGTVSRSGNNSKTGVRVGTILAVLVTAMLLSSVPTRAQTSTGKSGLPLPRYVSLKSDKVNLRTGPGVEYPTTWVYRRAGLPLEVFEESQNWRHVRDSEGTEGWIFSSLLSGRRTALVLPWERKQHETRPNATVYNDNSTRSRKVAIIEAGVIADIHGCDGRWCQVSIGTYDGYVKQDKLWGVYPNEIWD
ncbi:MAG: SH3 domain-containing protein [Alphaproteobacteria bacterium]|nr:SH3 domain-containing protein [Alphaproteobacteria bacterium]